MQTTKLSSARAFFGLMLIFSLALDSAAQGLRQEAAPSGKAGAPAANPSKPSGGPREGIQVRGDWAIVIRNQDGSVAVRHQFRNALVNFGVLPMLLARGGSIGRWEVRVASQTGEPCSSPTPNGGASPTACRLLEMPGSAGFRVLQVSASATDLVLSGSVQAANATQITHVFTSLGVCPPGTDFASGSCIFFTNHPFTEKDVTGLNIQVSAGQTMDVTVRISFS